MRKAVVVMVLVTSLAGLVVGGIVTQQAPLARDLAEMAKKVPGIVVSTSSGWVEGTITMHYDCVNIWPTPGINRCQCSSQWPVCGFP